MIAAPDNKDLESENGLLQFSLGMDMVRDFTGGRPFLLAPSHLQQLQKTAVNGIENTAGEWRGTPVSISGSHHIPPEPHLVPGLVQEMCDYVNGNWHEKTPLHLSAYVMWRLNWIHPFTDGNGRTSRIASYVVLCTKLGNILPGENTIPQQIQSNRDPYFKALEAADKSHRDHGNIDLFEMEIFLRNALAAQLLDVVKIANGGQIGDI